MHVNRAAPDSRLSVEAWINPVSHASSPYSECFFQKRPWNMSCF